MKNSLDNLFDFILKYKDIRFNIQPDDMDFNQMEAISNLSPFVYFRINRNLETIKEMQKRGIKFFIDAPFAPTNFSSLEEQISLGSSDIYVCEDLCYNLEIVKNYCAAHNVRVRLIINQIPSFRMDKGLNPKAPIFVPESIDELSKYIDVFEIVSTSWIKIDTYHRIWFELKKWKENLQFIYPELEIEIPNESLIPNFLSFKMNCGYKCGHGSPCKKCEQFVEIAQNLKKKNIIYKGEDKDEN